MRAIPKVFAVGLFLSVSVGAIAGPDGPTPKEVLGIATAFSDGGGYNAKWSTGTGSPDEIRFDGKKLLSRDTNGTYCSGFTFAVAMRVIGKHKLLAGRKYSEVRQLQRMWYGATKDSAERQCVYGVEKLGIGRAVKLADARAGDFLQLWRTKSGHSAIFVRWVAEKGKRVGLEYRSSQRSTRGVGNRVEYFRGVRGHKGAVDPARVYLCRLGR